MRIVLFGLVLSTLLTACSGEGPRDAAIVGSANATLLKTIEAQPYAVIEVNEAVATAVSHNLVANRYAGFFKQSGPAPVVIGVGDTLSISIISSSNTGFVDFAGGSLNPISTSNLPPQEVSSDGTVNIPPIGRLLARGKSVQSFENLVRRKLSEVLVDPSAIVQLSDRKSARVTVVGAVQAPGAIPLSATESKIIDIITAAGGPSGRTEDFDVTLTRRGRSATISMDHLYKTAGYNISARPGDIISVNSPLTEVTVLGAFATNTKVRLEGHSVSLTEAIGQFGGLARSRAKLKGVYVYRKTPRTTLASLGTDVSPFAGKSIPTIYKFDFTKPTAFFVADEFELAHGDILYTTQSVLSEINDVISAIVPIAQAPNTLNTN